MNTNVSSLDLQRATRVLDRCDALARCSDSKTGLTRTFLSPAMDEAHELVAGWMREAGMAPHVDEMGNLIGHFAAREEISESEAPVFLLGSHLDTVPNAGKYDGALGVVMAIEVVAALGESLPFAVEVIGFSEEEGVRFRTPYLGSRAIAGTFDANFLTLRDPGGTSMRQALSHFGLPADQWSRARYRRERVVGYLEAHIEQGPVLEAMGAPLGIVTAIAGQSRLRVRFVGHAGHSGTLPMDHRLDALTAASEWILAVESLAQNAAPLVATVGAIGVEPNAPNVVPGSVLCSLDVRHALDAEREAAVEKLLLMGGDIAARRGLKFETVSHDRQKAVAMDDELRHHLELVCQAQTPEIVSGAGHDAAIIASLCPTSMLFLRSPGGQSHCPEEAVEAPDIALGLDAMGEFLLSLAQKSGELVGFRTL